MNHAICCFFSLFAEAFILWQYAGTLFVRKRPAKIMLPVLAGLYLILFGVSRAGLTWLNVSMYLLVNALFLSIGYQMKWYAMLFHAAMLTAVMALCELPVYSVIERFSPHFYSNAAKLQNMLLFVVISKLIFFAIAYVLMHLLDGRQKQNGQRDHSTLLLISIPLTSVFVMQTFISICDRFTLPASLLWLISLSGLLLLSANLLVFGIYRYSQNRNAVLTEMQLLLQRETSAAEYYAMLAAQNENQSIFIHDMKQHLQSIGILSAKQEHEKVQSYIEYLLCSSELKESVQFCGHELLNAILCRYSRQCDGQGISFHADIRCKTLNFIDESDLTALFCNLLDNAFEAARILPNGFIEVSAAKNTGTPFHVITVVNSCRVDPFTGPDRQLPTKKSDRRAHGFGIKSIKRTVRKYNGDIRMYYSKETLTFHSVITLKCEAGM